MGLGKEDMQITNEDALILIKQMKRGLIYHEHEGNQLYYPETFAFIRMRERHRQIARAKETLATKGLSL